MKAIVLFLLLTSFLPAKTWIELAKEANFHLDHPGRQAQAPEQKIAYLEARLATLREIMAGSPALIESSPLSEPEHWSSRFIRTHLSLHQLTVIRLKRREWAEVDSLLALARSTRARILQSEPGLVLFLVASASSNTCFQSLPELATIQDPARKKRAFSKLHDHWRKTRVTRELFLLTEKGERRFAEEFAKDPQKYLKEIYRNLDAVPWTLREDFPHQLTLRDILSLPLDQRQMREEALARLTSHYQWLRGDTSYDAFQQSRPAKPARALNDYRSHPNGMGEFLRDGFADPGIAGAAARQIETNLLRDLIWRWLALEAEGATITSHSQLMKHLPASFRKRLQAAAFQIDFESRSISPTGESVLEKLPSNDLSVPQLFTD